MLETNYVLIWISLPFVLLSQHYLYFENSCDYEVFDLHPGSVYYVTWSGGYVTTDRCSYGFRAFTVNSFYDEYKICVEFEEYRIPECNVKLELESENGLITNYCGTTNTQKWCGGANEYVHVSLLNADRRNNVFTTSSKLRLKITAQMEKNHSANIVMIIVIVIVIVLVIITIPCLIRRYSRRKRSRDSQSHERGNVNQGADISTSTSQTTLSSQQVIYSTNINCDFDLVTNRSNEPPSYESVVKISPTDETFAQPGKDLQTQQDLSQSNDEPPPPPYSAATEYIISQDP